ncbi:Bug family tripartite tricarboxylate transporter substrate binding protein [Muricoccus pecuniae]|uniref:Tripartite-type tricarboxylate transporter receptor subunit TctC n=1 Tax=Muricoccus pecuniae TaxID=693023 RepID=A0A840XXI5_9PROT|nr:tripartite tricarboxylate transporter substrate binding protein [Roseomonas pecuniae]MBB5692596.1 tripartite-type tricarboxylate transporter receptor subunit TctC [Roseomonas pecuniae]
MLTKRGLGLAALGMTIGTAARAQGTGQGSSPGSAQGSGAAEWPQRQVTLVVPWAPGGSTDTLARVLAQRVSADLGRPVVVDNRPGASGTVGHSSVSRAQPDGYTLLLGTNSTYAMAPFLLNSLPYDNDRGFTPIGLLATNAQFFCVHPSVRANDIAELIALAKAQPGKISYSSSGAGSSAHLAVELLNAEAGVEMLHVPYRGGAPALQALIANEVQLSAVDAVSALQPMRAGAVRAIAVSSPQPDPAAPEVKPIAATVPGFESSTDFSLFAPPGVAPALGSRIQAAFARALESAEVREKLATMAIRPVGGKPEDFPAYQKRETEKWGGIIRARNIKPD